MHPTRRNDRYIENSFRASHIWLEYNPPEYEGDVLYVKAGVKALGLTETADEMYNILLKEKAAGYEKRIPADHFLLTGVPLPPQ